MKNLHLWFVNKIILKKYYTLKVNRMRIYLKKYQIINEI